MPRLRVSLTSGELEVEGPEDFVAMYDEIARSLLDRFDDIPLPTRGIIDTNAPGSSNGQAVDTGDHTLPAFGEALHALPAGASGTDQILLAGFYAQQGDADSSFATGDANKLLLDQGIKLANASQSLNNNQSAKRVFKAGKRWKIAKSGEEHLKALGIQV